MDAAAPGHRPVILVADDDPDIRSILTMLLREEGYRILEAADGQEALDHALSRSVDLILLDLGMPRLTGQGFCQAYRERDGQAPVILITAAHGPAITEALETCGAADCVTKPFDIERLLATIERHTTQPSAC